MLGEVAAEQGVSAWAARLWGAAETVRITGPSMPSIVRTTYQQYITAVQARLGEKVFQAALAEGRKMTPEQALTARGSAVSTASAAEQPEALPTFLTSSASPYPAGLTTREVEALRLVAQGMTDAQVAERLIISPRTVTTHLTSIYNKLGVNSRSAATRFAVERHLL